MTEPYALGRHREWFNAVYLVYVTLLNVLAMWVLPRTSVTLPVCLIAFGLPWMFRRRVEPKSRIALAASMILIGSIWLVVLAAR